MALGESTADEVAPCVVAEGTEVGMVGGNRDEAGTEGMVDDTVAVGDTRILDVVGVVVAVLIGGPGLDFRVQTADMEP